MIRSLGEGMLVGLSEQCAWAMNEAGSDQGRVIWPPGSNGPNNQRLLFS